MRSSDGSVPRTHEKEAKVERELGLLKELGRAAKAQERQAKAQEQIAEALAKLTEPRLAMQQAVGDASYQVAQQPSSPPEPPEPPESVIDGVPDARLLRMFARELMDLAGGKALVAEDVMVFAQEVRDKAPMPS